MTDKNTARAADGTDGTVNAGKPAAQKTKDGANERSITKHGANASASGRGSCGPSSKGTGSCPTTGGGSRRCPFKDGFSGKGLLLLFAGVIYFKFLYFDLLWALDTTFSGFQFPIGYVNKLIFATILVLPVFLWRSKWYIGFINVILDLWLIANLMYFRTYFTVIPSASYGLVGNLADFQDSVWESLRWGDIVFPLLTVVLLVALRRTNVRRAIAAARHPLRNTFIILGASVAVSAVYILCKGGYRKAYADLMYDYSTCGAAVYTIPGAMSYEWIKGKVELTPAIEARIGEWLDRRPGRGYVPPRRDSVPQNCIVLLLESFESWPIGVKVEGQELTPNLNRLLAEDHTFYAPNVQTQVKGARSIDAQLILHTGLLPVSYGAYSYRFIHNEYPSIDKAWRAQYGDSARAMSFTVDKRTVWNVVTVAQDFGFELYDKPYFVLDEKTGPRHRLGDRSFLRQAAERISDDSFWRPDGHTFLQCVTYSGHTPFIISEESKQLKLQPSIPERLRNFMQVTNYTDRAIGEFIGRLRANPKFDNTMIVILGDHEGLGADRPLYRRDPIAGTVVDEGWHTPLIVLNSPVSGRYEGTIGQIDLYPTLLDLLGLDRYSWRGIGRSVLDPDRLRVAVHPHAAPVGEDLDRLSADDLRHLRESYDISDLIISTNYFAKHPATVK